MSRFDSFQSLIDFHKRNDSVKGFTALAINGKMVDAIIVSQLKKAILNHFLNDLAEYIWGEISGIVWVDNDGGIGYGQDYSFEIEQIIAIWGEKELVRRIKGELE